MKKLVLVSSMVLATSAFAQERPHHVISIGTNGFGWSRIGNVFDWDEDKSGVDEQTASEGKLQLNYSYIFDNGVMLGAEISTESNSSEIKTTDGDKTESDTSETEYGLSLGYNFNDELTRSWWVKGTIGSGKYDSETKDEDRKSQFEYTYGYLRLSAGKRISLESWGLKNISYNPSVTIGSATVSGDAEDAGLETVTEARFDLIKLDILF